jgi:hypothetical protein
MIINNGQNNSKFKIINSKLKTIGEGLYPALIEDHQIKDYGGGLYPKLINSKLSFPNFAFCILNFEFKKWSTLLTLSALLYPVYLRLNPLSTIN